MMTIPFLEQLNDISIEKAGDVLELNCEKHAIDKVNWPDSAAYQPACMVMMAYSKTRLFLQFIVRGLDLLAENVKNLSPVANDSCVEFFMQVLGNPEYWNFEFNCIGAVNASHRVERLNAIRLNDEEIASIQRFGTCGNEPFSEKSGIYSWSLTVSIPFSLIGISNQFPEYIMGNFYKCAGKSSHPHYMSWAPIKTEKTNFHVPQFFDKIFLK